MTPALSLIIPANNEAAHISPCLEAVLASNPLMGNAAVQIIVVPNGCRDDTALIAKGFADKARACGWVLDVIELKQGSKLAALNAGDTAAKANAVAYLDADVVVSPDLLRQTSEALSIDAPRYATGTVQLTPTRNWVTRAYGTFYLQTPFMKQNAPGCGFFAMNEKGRARWADWPSIISDDTFARLNFAAVERIQVIAPYEWPLVDGLQNLIRVRRRQNTGVREMEQKFPELLVNEAKTPFAPKDVLKAVLRHPLGTLAYGAVSLIVKLTASESDDWKRGR